MYNAMPFSMNFLLLLSLLLALRGTALLGLSRVAEVS